MTKQEITATVHEIREMKRQSAELAEAIRAKEDSLKSVMADSGLDEITGNDFKITWKVVKSRRLDGKMVQAESPVLFEKCNKQTKSRRFTIA